MTQFSIELSPDAKQQVDSIARYIAIEPGNVSAALSFLDDVEASIENIRDNPYSHMVRERSARIDALGMAPKGDDTSFLNVDAVIHCKKDAADSWKDAGFGLDVVGDLEDGPPAAVLVAIVLLIVLFAFSSAIVMKVRRRMRT